MDGMKTRSFHAVLISAILILMACDSSEQPERPAASESSGLIPVIRNQSTADNPVAFELGTTRFSVPTEVVGPEVAYQGQNVDFVALLVFYPDFMGFSRASTNDQSHGIQISMRSNASGLPLELPATAEAAQDRVAQRYPESEFVRTFDEQLGLVGIRYRDTGELVAYRRPDDHVRPIDGLVPLVECHGSQPAYCDGSGYMPPNITVKYRFNIELLPNWKSIDSGVFKAIEGFRLEGI